MQNTLPLIVAITGASGAIFGVRLLECLQALEVPAHLVISHAGMITLADETDYSLDDVKKLAERVHSPKNIGASIASGSFHSRGMVIAPCSMRTLGEIASGVTTGLVSRTADVMLKERRKLVLMTRETPLNLIHLRNMTTVTEAGGIIAPPVPAFYHKPANLEAVIDHTVGRVLDIFDIENPFAGRWEGLGDNSG
jgi:4-hydroxy-3-polyprenylbenzoate decarboxylase